MHQEVREELRVRLKLVILELAQHLGVTKACREFNVPRSSFCRWKQKYEKKDDLDCIKNGRLPIVIPPEQRPKWWERS